MWKEHRAFAGNNLSGSNKRKEILSKDPKLNLRQDSFCDNKLKQTKLFRTIKIKIHKPLAKKIYRSRNKSLYRCILHGWREESHFLFLIHSLLWTQSASELQRIRTQIQPKISNQTKYTTNQSSIYSYSYRNRYLNIFTSMKVAVKIYTDISSHLKLVSK